MLLDETNYNYQRRSDLFIVRRRDEVFKTRNDRRRDDVPASELDGKRNDGVVPALETKLGFPDHGVSARVYANRYGGTNGRHSVGNGSTLNRTNRVHFRRTERDPIVRVPFGVTRIL